MKSFALIHVAPVAIVALALFYSSTVLGQSASAGGAPAPAPAPAEPPPSAGAPGVPGMPATVPGMSTPSLSPAPARPSGEQSVRIIAVRHADARTLVEQLKALMNDSSLPIIADDRTNQIIFRGTAKDQDEINQLIVGLDIEAPERPGTQNPLSSAALEPPRAPGWATQRRQAAVATPMAPQTVPPAVPVFPNASLTTSSTSGGGGSGTLVLTAPNAYTTYTGTTTIVDRSIEMAANQLREADAAAKAADAQLKQATELLKQAGEAAKSGKADESAAIYEKARLLVEQQRRASEEQRRKFESYRRLLESDRAAADAKRRATERSDQELAVLIDKLQELTPTPGADVTETNQKQLDDLKAKLKETISKQFDDRQKAMADEIKQLRQRLEKLEKQVSDRQSNRQSLIERGMNDALSRSLTVSRLVVDKGDSGPQLVITSDPNDQRPVVSGTVILGTAPRLTEDKPAWDATPAESHEHGDEQNPVGPTQMPPRPSY